MSVVLHQEPADSAETIVEQALRNCGTEQIHIPGSIQPHGALLALHQDGTLAACSANAEDLLGKLPAVGEKLEELHLGRDALDVIQHYEAASDEVNRSIAIAIHGSVFDIVMHNSEGMLIVEFEKYFEQSPPLFDTEARAAQRAISRICGARSLHDMLDISAVEIRQLTGFDRVMVYQFLHDDSGEVIAESKSETIDPLLGLRFPASDIPPQARRLYLDNPIRLIADCGYTAVPIVPSQNPLTGNSLDMSHCVLRSVSPVHVEYLKNMGVAASMSISIIVGGRLWGLFACHHATPRLVPHSLRMSCVVMSDIASAVVERHLAEVRLRELQGRAELRKAILAAVNAAPEILNSLEKCHDAMQTIVGASGCAIAVGGTCLTYGNTLAADEILALIDNPALANKNPFAINKEVSSFAADTNKIGGILAIQFDPDQKGYVFWFRNEEIENVRWAGNPEKSVSIGVHGHRLTPRTSFAIWREEIRGQSVPWTEIEKEIAIQLKNEIQAIALSKSTRLRLQREKLWATLGHDLRLPLQSIMGLTRRLGPDVVSTSGQDLLKRITLSNRRMGRLVSDIMDISKLQSGLGLSVYPIPMNLNTMIREIIQETEQAFPSANITFETGFDGQVTADADRLSQVLTNLISNAIAHGEQGCPVSVFSGFTEQTFSFVVSNHAHHLDEHLLATLFSPYKSSENTNPNNRQGLGLGLHIANEIVKSHMGYIGVKQEDGIISFIVTIPSPVNP